MFNPYILLATALVAILGFGFYTNPKAPNSPQTLTVGAILPLSGDFAFLGTQMQRGMELALEDYPASHIKIVYEDDQTLNNLSALNALKKLLLSDKAVIVLNDAVNTTKAIAPTLDAQKVPAVVFWDNNEELKGLSKYVFAMGLSTELAGSDMAQFAFHTLGVKSVYIASAQDGWSEIISNSFAKKFKELDGTINAHEKFPPDSIDFRTLIAKAKQAGSGAIYFPLFPQANESLIKQARELDYTGYLLTGDGLTEENIQNLGALSNGVYASLPYLANQSFLDKYRAKFSDNLNPINLSFAGLGYDAAKLVIDVVASLEKRGTKVTAEAIRNALPGFEFSGVTGSGKFSAEGIVTKKELLLEVHNGTFKPVQ